MQWQEASRKNSTIAVCNTGPNAMGKLLGSEVRDHTVYRNLEDIRAEITLCGATEFPCISVPSTSVLSLIGSANSHNK